MRDCASSSSAGGLAPRLRPSRPSLLCETSRETAQLTRVGGRLFLAKSREGAKGAKGAKDRGDRGLKILPASGEGDRHEAVEG